MIALADRAALRAALAALGVAALVAVGGGCGKKGAPVPPARTAPTPPPKAEAPEEKKAPQVEERRRIQPMPPP